MRICLYTDSLEQAKELDRLLWVFRPASFVPHVLLPYNDKTGPLPAVTVAWGHHDPEHRQALLNLSDTAPDFAANFSRVAELVVGDDAARALARKRYQYYRGQGCELHKQDMSGRD